MNAIPTGVVRSLAGVLLDGAPPERRAEVAAMTDDEFWVLLLTDPATAATARALRRDPAGWRTVEPAAGHDGDEGTTDFVVPRLYLDLPLVDGQPLPATHPALVGLPALPWRCTILRCSGPPEGAPAVLHVSRPSQDAADQPLSGEPLEWQPENLPRSGLWG